jgi:carboxypeptidase C (cathepsin A)
MLRPLLFAFALTLAQLAFADEPKPGDKPAPSSEAKKPDDKKDEKPKEEKPKEKAGQAVIGGQEVKYLAQTGTLPVLKGDGTPRANVFYIYYAATDADGKRLAAANPGSRPITFCFNGGPGAAAVWLHLGGLGPRKVEMPPDGLSMPPGSRVVDNPNSILDVSDLVFVDPVSTGLSRAAKGEKPEQFFGVDEDIEACGEFVRLFVTREQRWLSPKYLCGESYGVMRVGGLVEYLQSRHGMYFDGLMLMSGLINFQTLGASLGNDLPYVVFLPGFTATAYYHQKLGPELQADFEKTYAEVRAFAFGEYATALLQGSALPTAERRRIAEKIARLTSLTVEQVEDRNLRVDAGFFREMLLRKEGKIIGRFDARVTAADGDRSGSEPEFDPSFSNIIGPFSATVNAYVRGELGYESDLPYFLLAEVKWRWESFAGRYASVETRLAEALKTNPRLRVIVLTGRRDLAVPEDSMRYSLDHLPLPEKVRGNISWAHYESGHMMYLFQKDAEKLRRDLVEFVRASP